MHSVLRLGSLVLALGLALSVSVVRAQETTVEYRPTPYPQSVASEVHHIWDGWVTNVFYDRIFIQNDKLRVGGWGDEYRTYIRFNIEGLPANVTQAVLSLYPYASANGSPTAVDLNLINDDWNTSMNWNTQPGATHVGSAPAPTLGKFWDVIITPWYNSWVSDPENNYGLRLDPQRTWNYFNEYRSSRYGNDGLRPMLQLTFEPPVRVPDFKMPLPGGISWLVTTEVGCYDCKGLYNEYHDGLDYFSVDFSWRHRDGHGNQVYSMDAIPVLASAAGKVTAATFSKANGHYVVIDHTPYPNRNQEFSTRYLHLRKDLLVGPGAPVARGQVLGYMSNTGEANGVHLHFGTQYRNKGDSDSMVRYVVNDGQLLKGFQTECNEDNDWDRYYLSSNVLSRGQLGAVIQQWPVAVKDVNGALLLTNDYAHYDYVVEQEYHTGIDIPAASGTAVVAAASGEIVFIQEYEKDCTSMCEDYNLGTTVTIRHEENVYTQYSHLLEVTSVPHFQDHASDNWEPEGAGSDGVVNRSCSGRRSNMLSWSTCSIW